MEEETRNELISQTTELVIQLESLREKLLELPTLSDAPVEKEHKRWRAEEYKTYWFIDSDFTVDFEDDVCDYENDFKYETGNYFKTEEEAEQKLEHILIRKELKDIALRLNKGVEIDWEDARQNKYFLNYCYQKNEIFIDSYTRIKTQGIIYCLDENIKDTAIEEIGEERLINYLKES